jgi:hypothetical protein
VLGIGLIIVHLYHDADCQGRSFELLKQWCTLFRADIGPCFYDVDCQGRSQGLLTRVY